jgi:hypothetical protein
MKPITPVFDPGQIVATAGAMAAIQVLARTLETKPENVTSTLLRRHLAGDWGDVDDEDKALNDAAIVDGSRLLSAYHIGDSQTPIKFWIITEADRSSTTVLLPSEY